MLRVNLHLHSLFSDGVCTPGELARLLSLHRVSVASLTDHDTVEGVPAFLSSCRRRGIRAVSGVEISSMFENGDELHILGYRFDLSNPAMNAAFENYRVTRDRRNAAICERLTALGLPVSLKEAEARAGSRVVGRPHIAQVLVDKGRVPNLNEAFNRYIGQGKPAFVQRELLSTDRTIQLILGAGGLPVWAHPLQSLSDPDSFGTVLDRLKSMGLWGVECWFHNSTPAQTFVCLRETGRRGLFTTAGTDFHGRRGHSSKISGWVVNDDLLPWARFCGGL